MAAGFVCGVVKIEAELVSSGLCVKTKEGRCNKRERLSTHQRKICRLSLSLASISFLGLDTDFISFPSVCDRRFVRFDLWEQRTRPERAEKRPTRADGRLKSVTAVCGRLQLQESV